jgi:hypothetical protein
MYRSLHVSRYKHQLPVITSSLFTKRKQAEHIKCVYAKDFAQTTNAASLIFHTSKVHQLCTIWGCAAAELEQQRSAARLQVTVAQWCTEMQTPTDD